MNLPLFFKSLAIPNRRTLAAIQVCGSLEQILKTSDEKLQVFFEPGTVGRLKQFRETGKVPDNYCRYVDVVERMELNLIVYGTEDYPVQLAEIPDPPSIFFAQGSPKNLHKQQISVVGSRKSTAQGEKIAQDFAAKLNSAGFGITSGLAAGIDSAAHQGALSVSGITCAVMGTGPDLIYPRRHANLAEQILESKGVLVSEYLPGSPPRAEHFPQRNRIVTGLSLGVLVVEAGERSGSLISARLGAEQGREVFAVPGSIFSPVAAGCNRLIREGATLVSAPEQIVEQIGPMLGYQFENQRVSCNENHVDSAPHWLLEKMGFDPVGLDDLCAISTRSSSEIASTLAELELDGKVERTAYGYQRLV